MGDGSELARDASDYLSYLLRLWRIPGPAGTDWRASLESPHGGERLGFCSLEALFTYLREQAAREDLECHSKE